MGADRPRDRRARAAVPAGEAAHRAALDGGRGIPAALLGGIVARALDLGSFLQFVVAVALAAGLIALLGGTSRVTASS